MLPFYKTFPFMDYYKNEDAFAKDLGMIKDMYPLDTAMIQSAVCLLYTSPSPRD